MSLNIKTTLNAVVAPEVPQILGNLHIKTTVDTTVVNAVTKLYRKINNSTTAVEVVWEPQLDNQTNEATEPNPPICGICEESTLRYYPIIPNTLNSRWDCSTWQKTGKVMNQVAYVIDGTIVPNFNNPSGTGTYANATITHPTTINEGHDFQPPPLNHILMDYATYGVADRITIIDNNAYAQRPVDVDGLLTTPSGCPFATFLSEKYRFKCNAYPTTITDPNFVCNLRPKPPIISDIVMCTCVGTELSPLCNTTTPPGGPETTGEACISNEEILEGTNALNYNIIIDTTCIFTSDMGVPFQCNEYCYGNPFQHTAVLASPSQSNIRYHCRDTGYVPNVLIGELTKLDEFNQPNVNIDTVRADMFAAAYHIGEFLILADDGCDPTRCLQLGDPTGNPLRCNGSGWGARIFLPFYVNVPTDVVGVNSISLCGKLIKFSENAPLLELGDNDLDQYSNHPALTQMYHLLRGDIRGSCIVMGNAFDVNKDAVHEVNPNKLIWGAVGYPQMIGGVPTHTHQVVVEFGSPGAEGDDGCTECWFSSVPPPGGGIGGIGGGDRTMSLKRFRLYPITDNDGTRYTTPLQNQLTFSRYSSNLGSNTGDTSNKGIANLDIIHKPIRSNGVIGDLIGQVCTDIFTNSSVSTNAEISCGNILLTLQQPKITQPVNIDCSCTAV